MTRLSEIGQEMDAERVPDMCRQWARDRGLTTIPDRGVMHYIERLESALKGLRDAVRKNNDLGVAWPDFGLLFGALIEANNVIGDVSSAPPRNEQEEAR